MSHAKQNRTTKAYLLRPLSIHLRLSTFKTLISLYLVLNFVACQSLPLLNSRQGNANSKQTIANGQLKDAQLQFDPSLQNTSLKTKPIPFVPQADIGLGDTRPIQDSPYSLGIEVYKGINLIYRNIQGQKNYWGANGNAETDFVSIPNAPVLEYRD